jgi:2-methylisocitrate lyase-like PEP mutase family enzyme
MAATQHDKIARFRALHAGEAFVIANAWDAGSAKILAGMGFPALATSSGACAGILGRRDGEVTRDEALAHARAVVEATDLPVSADLEKGFADAPEEAAETYRRAAAIGLAGATIEDASGDPAQPIYTFDHAVARVAAAAAATRGSGFMLTARAEGFLRNRPDLDDTIRRLKAFEAAGADVLMAPGLPDLDAVRQVCAALERPFNFMAGIPRRSFTVAELAACGVRRISLATSLYRAAMTGVIAAAREVQAGGTFGYVDTSVPGAELNAYFR